MASRKKKESTLASPPSGAGPARLLSGELLIGIGLLLLLFTSTYYGWKKWGAPVTQQAEYRLSAESIEISPPPPWIRSDIKSEALRDGSLAHVSIFDKDLSVRVYRAFEMHAWVERVNHVRKRPPARVIVDLEYRRPVAWVEVPLPENQVGLVPVDGGGVVLPTNDFTMAGDFTKEQADDYPRITVAQLAPNGLAGAPWGDPRVTACAQIAALLAEDARALPMHRILATLQANNRLQQETWLILLIARSGQRFIWGSPPGQEAPGEATALQKKMALRQIATALHKTGAAPPSDDIDLRDLQAALTGRTAHQPPGPYR